MMPKQGPNHPWITRTRAQVITQAKKKKRYKTNETTHLLEQAQENESLEHEEEINKQLREFFL